MKVKVGVSNRHVHLNTEDFKLLFGDITLEKRNDLSQKGEFASTLTVDLIGPKNIISNVRVMGPLRDYTQVEVSKTDCYNLGIKCPIRASGDLQGAATITIQSDLNSITKDCGIISERHIHINKTDLEKYGLVDKKYKVKVVNEKGGILDNVSLKIDDNYQFELHLDTDDANAFLIEQGMELEIID